MAMQYKGKNMISLMNSILIYRMRNMEEQKSKNSVYKMLNK